MRLQSPVFAEEEYVPEKHGYKRDNTNPPLEISGVPDEAKSLVLIMDDPDAREPAGKIWDHWVVWNIPPATEEITEDGVPGDAEEGMNDYGEKGYGGPHPPDETHTYRFRLYAIDTELDLPEDADKEAVKEAMKGHIVEKAGLDGLYDPIE